MYLYNWILLIFLLMLPISIAHISSGPHTEFVNVSSSGFSPDFLTVEKGSIVVWGVQDDGSYWPASNFHPTHEAYPGGKGCIGSSLDACRGLKKGDTYNFTFDKVGKWGIHDHLHTTYTMLIGVVDGLSESLPKTTNEEGFLEVVLSFLGINKTRAIYEVPKISAKEQAIVSKQWCDDERNWGVSTEKNDCYAKQMRNLSFNYGRDFAYAVLFELQKMEPNTRVCHFIVHGIGWGLYEKNPADWQNLIAESRNECSYAEQMGILEYYLTTLPEGKLRKEQVPGLCGPNAKANCNHAIGHMLLLIKKNNISEAIDWCHSIADRKQKFYCTSGVFMERISSTNLLEHGLVPKTRTYITMGERLNESEALCRSYDDVNAASCWQELSLAATQRFNRDPNKVFDFCNTAQTTEAADRCKMHSLFEFLANTRFNLTKVKYICTLQSDVDPNFEKKCYDLFAQIRISTAGPKATAPDVIDYCLSLPGKFSESCFITVGNFLKELGVGTTGAMEFCKTAPKNYKELCIGGSAAASNSQSAARDRKIEYDNPARFGIVNIIRDSYDYISGFIT